MNWLAHLHLAEPTPAFRLGSLLPDLVAKPDLAGLPEEFQAGIQRHWQIDAFTDAHPLFRRSVQRFQPPFRRYGGILVDVFYDHMLACHWQDYSAAPLPEFVAAVYAGFPAQWHWVPERVRLGLARMQAEDWLGSYRELAGIAATLDRIGRRLRRPVDLGSAVQVLEAEPAAFYADFAAFYPALQAEVSQPERSI